MSNSLVSATAAQIIREYYWGNTAEETTALVTESMSGWIDERSSGSSFSARPTKDLISRLVMISETLGHPSELISRLVMISETLGHPSDLFKESITKVCSVVIRTQRSQNSPQGRATFQEAREPILSFVIERSHSKWKPLREAEALIQRVLPKREELPKEASAPCYRLVPDDSEKGVKIEKISTASLARKEDEEPPKKRQKLDSQDPSPSQHSPDSMCYME